MKIYWCIDRQFKRGGYVMRFKIQDEFINPDSLSFKLKLGHVCNAAFDGSITISSGRLQLLKTPVVLNYF